MPDGTPVFGGSAPVTCAAKMDETTGRLGHPERVYQFGTNNYQSQTWVYASGNVLVTFTWGAVVAECDESFHALPSPV